MSITRRDLLRSGVVLGLAASCSSGSSSSPSPKSPPVPAPIPKKKILILGGTGFLGPHTIAAATARGHTVTIFNRGKREKYRPLEIEVEHLYGNRDPDKLSDEENPASPKGLEQLKGRTWDVVIDNSGYVPRMVAASANLLANSASQYIFISSISAYDDVPATGGDETARLAELTDPTVEDMGKESENYGGLKVLCERAASAAFGARATIVRPGYIIGPGDPTDRFTYWPVRISRGGDVLAPGAPDDPLQWIDVRDLSEWLVNLAEKGTAGSFNAVGPKFPARWGDVLDTCVAAAPGAKLEWVPAAWLEKNGAGGEDAFPIWIPPVGKYAGFHRWNNDRAEAAGLTFRPLVETVKELLAWYAEDIPRRVRITKEMEDAAKAKGAPPPKTGGAPDALRAGPTREREQELLAAFRAKP